jgi:hypothetical protein
LSRTHIRGRGSGWDAFITSVGRPEARQRIAHLMELGLQKNPDVEQHLADYTGKLRGLAE